MGSDQAVGIVDRAGVHAEHFQGADEHADVVEILRGLDKNPHANLSPP